MYIKILTANSVTKQKKIEGIVYVKVRSFL